MTKKQQQPRTPFAEFLQQEGIAAEELSREMARGLRFLMSVKAGRSVPSAEWMKDARDAAARITGKRYTVDLMFYGDRGLTPATGKA